MKKNASLKNKSKKNNNQQEKSPVQIIITALITVIFVIFVSILISTQVLADEGMGMGDVSTSTDSLAATTSTSSMAGGKPLPGIDVALTSYNPSPAHPGQIIDFVLTVSHTGTPASDARIELVEEYPFTILFTEDVSRGKNLAVTTQRKLQYRIQIADDAKDGITPLTVRYAPKQGTSYTRKRFDINIETFSARISIDKVIQDPKRFHPGEEGTLTFFITNYENRVLRNVDVVIDFTNSYDANTNMDNMLAMQTMVAARLTNINEQLLSGSTPQTGMTNMQGTTSTSSTNMDDNGMQQKSNNQREKPVYAAIAPTTSSSIIRLEEPLSPGETRELSFIVQTMPDATPGIYALPIYVNYQDSRNNPFHMRTEVPIIIDMPNDPAIQLMKSGLRSKNIMGEIAVLIANRGFSDMRFTTLELRPHSSYKLITAPSEVYIGTLMPGEAMDAMFMILPRSDVVTLPVSLTYRDAHNNLVTEEKLLELDIINMNYYKDMSYEMMVPWFIAAIVFLLLTIYFVGLKRKDV